MDVEKRFGLGRVLVVGDRGMVSPTNLHFLSKRTLAYQLAKPLAELSGTDAIAAMRSIGLTELAVGGETIRLVPRGGRDARGVLSALGITDLDPPAPRKRG